MTVYLFSFSKRENSTAQPVLNTGTSFSVQLKDNCSTLEPVLIFNPGSTGMPNPFNPSAFNYAYIASFSRYYFVKDWTYRNGVWEVALIVDVLASYKTAIGNLSAYVVRSASQSDGTVIDGFYPATSQKTIQRVSLACSYYGVAPSGGCYVVGIINNVTSGNVGSVCYYCLTSSQLANLLAWLFSSNIFTNSNITEMGEGLFKSMFNPFQYFTSAMWFPFAVSSLTSASDSNIVVGYWTSSVSGKVLTNLAQSSTITGTIPDHPQISRGSYLNYAPYTALTMYVEPFGAIPLDPSFRNNGNYIYSQFLVDHVTGEALLRCSITASGSPSPNYITAERSAKIAVPIQLAQVASDYVQTLGSAAGVIGSALSLDLAGIAGNIINGLQSAMPKAATMGVNGSFSMTIPSPLLICEFTHIANENNSEFGRPLCANKTLNSLSGFIQCGDADHAVGAFEAERNNINTFLKNGFYYE